MDVDVNTMRPIDETGPLPPLKGDPGLSPFERAFADARARLGRGKTFDFKGKKYTTDYKEEVATPGNKAKQKVASVDKGDEPEASDNINEEEQENIQQELAAEKPRPTKRVSAGRAGYVDVPLSDEEIAAASAKDQFDNMLNALIVGGAGAGAVGIGAAVAKGQRQPAGYRPSSMQEGDLYGQPTKAQPTEPQIMTDADIGQQRNLANQTPSEQDKFFNDQLNTMTDDANTQYLKKVLQDGESFLPEEQAAAKDALAGKDVQEALRRLKALKADPKLMKALMGLL